MVVSKAYTGVRESKVELILYLRCREQPVVAVERSAGLVPTVFFRGPEFPSRRRAAP